MTDTATRDSRQGEDWQIWLHGALPLPLHGVVVDTDSRGSDGLYAGEVEVLHTFSGAARRRDWLRGRQALKLLLKQMGLDADTASIAFPNPRFSLSHTKQRVVAVGCAVPGVSGVGIDIEGQRRMRRTTLRFFLTAAEQAWVCGQKDWQRATLMLWVIKEAIFKADQENRNALLCHYEVHNPKSPTGIARKRASSWTGHYACRPFYSGYLAVAMCVKGAS